MILKSKKTTVESLGKESDEIFSIFTETQNRCNQLNEKVNALAASKKEEANKLLAEVSSLENIAKRNTNLSDKITQFLNS